MMNVENIDKVEFKKYIHALIHSWTQTLSILASVLVPMFFALDFLTVPKELLSRFFIYRLISTVASTTQYFILRNTKSSEYASIHGYIISFILSIAIVQMTVDLGGFNSPYYAGLILVIMASNLIIPWSHIHSIINGSFTILLYILMNAIFGKDFEWTLLINNLAFLSGSLIIVASVKYLNYNKLKTEFIMRSYMEHIQVDQLSLVGEASERVIKGDLTVQINLNSDDDSEKKLIESFNHMLRELQSSLVQVNEAFKSVSVYSQKIKTNSKMVADGAKDQLKYTENSVQSITGMIKEILKNADKMERTSDLALNALQITNESEKVLNNSISAIIKIDDVVKSSQDKVHELQKSSEKINEIIQSIIDIADKTNLLSLNASIEAARAGEQGRGFGIVAIEIGKLAEQTASATHETTSIIKTLLKDIKGSIESFASIAVEIETAKSLVTEIESAMGDIRKAFEKLNSMIIDISQAGKSQASGGEQIQKNIEYIDEISKTLTGSIGQIANISNDLDDLVNDLNKNLSKFKLN